MVSINSTLPEVLIIEPQAYEDDRGWFMESYNRLDYSSQGIDVEFVQDNHSFSKNKGTIRGLHMQNEPWTQAKLVRCINGSILDVAVDVRRASHSFGKWASIILSSNNMKQVFLPKGFAHGFLTLEDETEVEYKVDRQYNKASERTIRFDDPDIGIEWGVENPIISLKDMNASRLRNVDIKLEL